MARKASSPNVVWLMTDEQRRDSLGCYRSGWADTPVIDRIAAEGAQFEEAITPSPLCVPARSSILTGSYPGATGVFSNAASDPAPQPDLISLFRQAGYRTGSFGKSHYAGFPARTCFETEEEYVLSDAVDYTAFRSGYREELHGVVKYPSPYTPWILGGWFPLPEQNTSEHIAITRALEWLDEGDGRPFFMRISLNGPHTPVVPPRRFLARIAADRIAIADEKAWKRGSWPSWYTRYLREYARSDRLTEQQLRDARHSYYAECAYIDEELARVVARLEERSLLEETIVAFVSDHGTHLGDFGFVQKQTFFQPVVTVPMVIRYPGHIPPAIHVRTPVSVLQLLPTLLDFCGIQPPRPELSLKSPLEGGREPPARPIFSQYTLGSIEKWGLVLHDHLTMVRHDGWKLCFSEENDREGLLFAIDDDSNEERNLFDLGSEQPVVRRLKSLCRAAIR